MVALLERAADRLEDGLFVVLANVCLQLLRGLDVVLEIATSVLPCLQSLVKQLGGLAGIFVWDGVVGRVGAAPHGEGGVVMSSAGHGGGQRQRW